MSDEIPIQVDAKGADGVERLITSLDRLHASLNNLGNTGSALARLENSMQTMQASMSVGFAEQVALVQKSGERQAQERVKSLDKIEKQQLAWEARQHANANKYHDRAVEIDVAAENRRARTLQGIIEKRDTDEYSARVAAAARLQALTEKRDSEEYAARSAALTKFQALVEKRDAEEYAARSAATSKLQGIVERRDMAEYEARAASTAKFLALVEKRDLTEYEMRAAAAARLQALVEKRDLDEYTARAAAAARGQALVEKRDLDEYTSRAAASARLQGIIEKRDAEEYALRNAAAAKFQAMVERRDMEEYSARSAAAARLQALTEKRDMEEYSARSAAAARLKELEQKQQAELYAIRAAAQERQRSLDTAFMTSSLAQQIAMAEKAKVYSSLGGNATVKYGGAAAGADLVRMKAEYDRLNPAVEQSRRSILTHNEAMREGHALARGLAGSLGGLWLTYGSAVPLLAGAAIATALKNVVSVGMEVEKQLTFVFALSEEAKGVDLGAFLSITDSSLRSVVESANAMRALAQNGLEAGQSLAVLPAILDLATVGEMTAAQAALAATGATSAFGLSMFEASRVADIFSKAAATSNTSVLAMTESMKQASTVASLFKVSIEDTAAMIGLLAKINITGGAAGTSITNMLTGLYEPTEKAKRALKELGVVTHTATGELKPIQEVLGEMRASLSSLNESARVDILGSIFTVRGVKSAQLFLENLDGLKVKSEEAAGAAGYMRGVIEKLEDSSSGAFTRLGVTIQNTFTKAFVSSAPYIQELGVKLGDMARSGESPLSNLSLNLTKLTLALVENLDVVVLLGAAYLAWNALAGVRALVMGYAAAVTVATVAQTAATAASAAYTAANAAGAATSALWTAALETQTAATTAATAASAAGSAIIMPALAALAIAVAAGTALWLLFRDSTDDAHDSNLKLNNSLHAIKESIDREIESLEKVNALWDEKNGKYRDSSSVTPASVDAARDEVAILEARIRAQGRNPALVRTQDRVITTMDPTTGVPIVTRQVDELADALARADKTLANTIEQGQRFEQEVLPAQAIKKQHDAVQQLREELDKFIKLGTDKNSKGELDQKNTDVLAKYQEATKIKAALFDPALQEKSVEAESARINALSVDLRQLKGEAQSLLSGRAPKADAKGENDALRAAIERNAEARKLLDIKQKTQLLELTQQNAAGNVGDIEYLTKKNDLAKSAVQAAIDEAKANIALVEGGKNKLAATQKYQSLVNVGREQSKQLDIQLDLDKAKIFQQAQDEQLKYQQKTLQDQGQNAAAFLIGYEAQYGTMIKKLQADLAAGDEATRASAQKSLDYLAALGKAGVLDSVSKDLQDGFNAALSTMTTGIAALTSRSTAGAGLSTIFDNALAAEKLWAAGVDEAMTKQRALQALADQPDASPKDQKIASDALKKINDEAAKVQNVWTSVGDAIGKSLTDAFGRAGTAVGGLLTATLQYANARKKIEDDFKDQEDSPETRIKMAKATASAQINAYGNMAGAAKGFFKEGSKGYEALGKAEKIFRVAELAMSAQAMVQKLFELTVVAGAKATTNSMEVTGAAATTTAVVAAEGVKSTAYGVTALAAALALPFPANLPAFAVVAAMLAAIGVVVGGASGGGAPSLSEQRQAANGTGTVLGDSKAKSDSIAKALAMVEGNTYRDMLISSSMLASLRNIESSLSNLGNLLVSTGALTGAADDVSTGTTVNRSQTMKYGATIGSFFGPIGTIIGTAVGALAGVMAKIPVIGGLVSKLFGTSTSVKDFGITAGSASLSQIDATGLKAQSYADVQSKSKFFGLTVSNKNSTQLKPLEDALNNQFTLVITSLADGVTAAADVLGVGGAAFNARLSSFVVDLGKISFKDLKGDEIEAALQAAFSKVGDDMATFALGSLTQYQKIGEGTYETLIRIANDYATIDAVLGSFNKSFGAVGMASVAAREELLKLSGGLEEFTSQGAFFLENFFSDAEKAATLRTSVNAVLSPLNQGTAVTSIEQFKQLALAQDLTTDAGRKTYTSMMSVAQAFVELMRYGDELGVVVKTADEILSERKDLQQQLNEIIMTSNELLNLEREALDASNRALFDQIQAAKAVVTAKDALAKAYETEAAAGKAALEKAKSWVTTLNGLNPALQLGAQSTLTPEQKYAEARAQFEQVLSQAIAGDTTAQGKLSAAEQAFLSASQIVNANDSKYTADYNRVLAANNEAVRWASVQVDVQQASLDTLKASVSGLITLNDTTLTVVQAIRDLQAATEKAAGLGVKFSEPDKAAAAAAARSTAVAATFEGTNYSATSTAAAEALTAEVRRLNETVSQMKEEAVANAAALAAANAAASKQNAEEVVDGVKSAAQTSVWTQNSEATLR